jgi:hypothetical protein
MPGAFVIEPARLEAQRCIKGRITSYKSAASRQTNFKGTPRGMQFRRPRARLPARTPYTMRSLS